MTTKKLFNVRSPRVGDHRAFSGGVRPPENFVFVMRPHPLGNPFKIGQWLCISFLKSQLSLLGAFPGDGERYEDWVKRLMPVSYGVLVSCHDAGAPLGRAEAILCYSEWIRLAVKTDVSKRTLVLSLEGKTLLCCCYPKACHAEEITKVFKELKAGLL